MEARDLSRRLVVLALSVGLGLAAGQARAQAYKYKDDSGHVHFTQDLGDIPAKYRARVETREMPERLDPNAPKSLQPKDGTVGASFENGVRHGLGRDLTIKQQNALYAWMARWMWPLIGTVVLNLGVALAMAFHAFATGRIAWGLGTVCSIGVASPVYLVMHLEQNPVVRIALVLLYLAPFIVLGMSIQELLAIVG